MTDDLTFSASDDSTLKVWDLDNGACLATFFGESEIYSVALGTDGRTIVAGERSGRLHFLRLKGVE